MKRIGILGGTFDPIHYGHLRPMEQAGKLLQLDELRLMPNHIPPHKAGTHATLAQRLAMLEQAIETRSTFALELIELNREKPSYTVDTLCELRASHPNDALFFLMGTDSFCQLNRWHCWEKLLPLANLVVTQRPGDTFPRSGEMADYYDQHARNTQTVDLAGGIYRLMTDTYDISSTQIRQAISTRQHNWHSNLPSNVAQYIVNHHIYHNYSLEDE